MKTSYLQYVMMVEFMEANGDLSKPSGGPRGRHYVQLKWKELSNKLNSDGTGDPRSEDKWRKVWSDYKNNCKKKLSRITRAASGTGGGPALKLSLTDLEERVIQIIGVQAVTGMVVEEAGFQQDEVAESSHAQLEKQSKDVGEIFEVDCITPGTSSQPTVVPPPPSSEIPPSPPTEANPPSPPVASVDEEWRPPQKKNKKDLTKIFIDSDRKAREYARERDRDYNELEKERLRIKAEEIRVKEFEVQERVRQRDLELQLQAQWQDLIKQAMEVFVRFIEKRS